jgi:ribosomal protein S12 methylthiotransferase accessory factor
VSGSGKADPNLFARAATLLSGNAPGDADDSDARSVLRELDYTASGVLAPGEAMGRMAANRVQLLNVASRFARVFQLTAPEAPGLVCFGAEFDPVIADSLHQGSPMVGASGIGLSLQQAFQGCIGEGVEYLSQLQTGTDVLLAPGIDDRSTGLGPLASGFVADLSKRRAPPDAGLSSYRATRLIDGSGVLLPADICLRRPPAQRELPPPFPLSIGSAAGSSWEAAVLHGLLELIERDAASLWWRGGRRGRSIPPGGEADVTSKLLLWQLRHTEAPSRRTWLLDITTDAGVPCVAAVSCGADGFGLAFGLAARPKLAAAAHSAILEMCQIELALAVVVAKQRERGDAGLNEADRVHLRRSTTINADRCALLQPVSEPTTYLDIATDGSGATSGLIVRRLEQLGIETFCLDLTRPHLAVPVARLIAPGLQLEPSGIVTARLADAIAQTGGGTTYTGGVALM